MKVSYNDFWNGWQANRVQRPGQYVWNTLKFGQGESWPEFFYNNQMNIHEAIAAFEERYGAIEWEYNWEVK